MIRVLIVADAGLFRGALTAVLSDQDDLAVTSVGAREDALAAAHRHGAQVAVIDLDLTDGSGPEVVRRLAGALPCPVVALARAGTPGELRQALDARVRGFASKDRPPEELAELIRRVATGERVIDAATALAALATAENPLTGREREVLRLAAEGLTTRAMARRLFLAEGTVRNHLSSALRKTGSRNRLEALRYARDAGWL